jgi:phage terminase small subunit
MPDDLPVPARQQDRAVATAIGALVNLPMRQQRYVHHRLQLIAKGEDNSTEAARLAGYAPATANREGARLNKTPKIMAVFDAVRLATAVGTLYSQATAMDELERGMAFAEKTENASAYIRGAELRARIAGVLVDRVDARVAVGAFAINVIGLEAGNG